MSKIGLIYQPCGLGDILFLQKLARFIKGQGYEVYWPVVSELAWLDEYIDDFNFVSWGDEDAKLTGPPLPDSVQFPQKDFYLPSSPTLQTDDLFFFQGFADHALVMAGKYQSIDLPWQDWAQHVRFERNLEREHDLFYNHLGLSDDEDYVFVNRNYMIRPEVRRDERIAVLTNKRVVELDIVPGFTLFDWCTVMERAHSVHMIETALNYVMESPTISQSMMDKELVLYSRNGSFAQVSYLFHLPWKYVTS